MTEVCYLKTRHSLPQGVVSEYPAGTVGPESWHLTRYNCSCHADVPELAEKACNPWELPVFLILDGGNCHHGPYSEWRTNVC